MVLKKSNETDVDNSVESVENSSKANVEKINLVMDLLSHQFNIDNKFYLIKVCDSNNNITMGFGSADHEVSIKVKNLINMGIEVK